MTTPDYELIARMLEQYAIAIRREEVDSDGFAPGAMYTPDSLSEQAAALRAIAAARRQGQASTAAPVAWRTVYPDGSHSAWHDGSGRWPETKGFVGGAHGWEYAFAPPSAPVGVEAAVERLKDRAFPSHECPAESAAVWNTALYEMQHALAQQPGGRVAAVRGAAHAALDGKYGEVLRPFVAAMEYELHANAGKGDRPGWLAMSADTCLLEIYYHLGKLQKAVRKEGGAEIQEFAADVANMSMMLLDICGGLALIGDDPVTTPPAYPLDRRDRPHE